MKLARLDLIAFGPFREMSLDFGGADPGFFVLYAPNETGKSTTLRAVSDLLYGIPSNTRDAHRHRMPDLRIGARVLDRNGAPLEVVRRKGNLRTLLDPSGEPVDEALWTARLGDVSRETFLSMWGLDPERLLSGAEGLLRADGQVGPSLFEAGLGVGLERVAAELEREAQALYRPRGSQPPINRGMSELLAACEARTQAERALDDFVAVEQRLAAQRNERAAAVAEQNACRAAQSRAERLERARPILLALDCEDATRDGPADAPAERALVAAEPRQRFRALEARIAEQTRQLAAQRARTETEAAPPEREDAARFAAEAPRIRAFLEADRALARDRSEVERLRAALAGAEQRKAAFRAELPPGATLSRALSTAERGELAALAEHESVLERDRLRLSAELTRLEQRAAQVCEARARLGPTLDPAKAAAARSALTDRQAPATARKAADRALRAQLAELGLRPVSAQLGLALGGAAKSDQLDRAWPSPAVVDEWLSADRALRAEARFLAAQRPAPEGIDSRETITRLRTERAGALAALDPSRADWAACFARFAAIEQALDRAVDQALTEAPDGFPVAALVAARARLGAAQADSEGRLRAIFVDCELDFPEVPERWALDYQRFVDTLAGRPALLAAERRGQAAFETLALSLGLNKKVSAAQLSDAIDRAEAEQNGLRAVERAEAEIERERSAGLAAEAERQAELRAHRERWPPLAQALGFDPALCSPRAAFAALGALELLAELSRTIENDQQRVAELEARLARHAAEAHALAQRIGGRAEMPGFAAELRANLEQTEQARRETELSALRRRERAVEQAEAEAALAATHQALAALVAEVGAADTAELAARVAASERANASVEERSRKRAELAALAEGEPLETFAAAARASEPIDRAALERTRLRAEARISELDQAIGADRAWLAQVDGRDRLAQLSQSIEDRVALLERDVARFAVVQLASQILRAQVERYRAKNERPLLARAGALLAELTRGQLIGLDTAHDSKDRLVLKIVRDGGAALPVSGLSDGARDQLYLALRLATIEQHLDRGLEPLPLLLDDVLVHFDDRRAQAALHTLGELSRRTQVILLTHHEHMIELARQASPRAVIVQYQARAARITLPPRPAPTPARTAKKSALAGIPLDDAPPEDAA